MADEPDPPAIRHQYEEQGAREFYERQGANYRNPHEDAIASVLQQCVTDWSLDMTNVLDLACGSGEVTLTLQRLGVGQVTGVDPFTYAGYQHRTGQPALRHSFEDIAAGALAGESFGLIICSYALHLVEESRLPGLLFQLATLTPRLLVLSPHKRPEIRPEWGWHLIQQSYCHRVRARLFETPTG